MTQPLDIGEIVAMLTDRLEGLVDHLFPHAIRTGPHMTIGSLAGEPGNSLVISLRGAKRGTWCDFARHQAQTRDGYAGDALDLVAQALYRGDKGEAIRFARRWLGIDAADPAELARARRVAERSAAQRAAEAEAEAERLRAAALRIFLSAQSRIKGTPVDAYLRGARGIDLAALGRQPGSLRYHPHLWNAESQRHWPGMVALIDGCEGGQRAVHRTWLEIRDNGSVHKAPLENAKATLGAYRGGSIRLWRGGTGKPLAQAAPDEIPGISEGIEDGLTAACADPARRILAAVSLGNVGNLALPKQIGGVLILGQNDAPGSPAARSLEAAIATLQDRGLKVWRAVPPPDVKDINELAQKGEREAAALGDLFGERA